MFRNPNAQNVYSPSVRIFSNINDIMNYATSSIVTYTSTYGAGWTSEYSVTLTFANIYKSICNLLNNFSNNVTSISFSKTSLETTSYYTSTYNDTSYSSSIVSKITSQGGLYLFYYTSNKTNTDFRISSSLEHTIYQSASNTTQYGNKTIKSTYTYSYIQSRTYTTSANIILNSSASGASMTTVSTWKDLEGNYGGEITLSYGENFHSRYNYIISHVYASQFKTGWNPPSDNLFTREYAQTEITNNINM